MRRYMVGDTGWNISLDLGLDIFQKFEMNDALTRQIGLGFRQVKAFEVTYLKTERKGA